MFLYFIILINIIQQCPTRPATKESIEILPISILKRSRNEASSSNLSRVKFGNENQVQSQGKPSKAQTKMAKRLELILPMLESLHTH